MEKDNKILSYKALVSKVKELRKSGRKVILSMGVYDLIHPGIITHLSSAKSQGDVLVVAVMQDKDATVGPGRPLFPESFRAKNVAAIGLVDYVCVAENSSPFECVRKINPDVFAKGRMDRERDLLIFGKDIREENKGLFGNATVFETDGFSFSSSHIINKLLDLYPEGTKQFLRDFSRNYEFEYIAEKLHSLKDLKVLLIGDGILDEYNFCEPMNKSPKSPLVVNRHLYGESYVGGAFAIANHLAGLCDHVHLVSLLGREDSKEDMILGGLKPNVRPKFFYRDDGPTIVKKRYLNEHMNQKLFEINFINNHYIGDDISKDIGEYIRSVIHDYDLTLVSDFGHGLITKNIMKTVERNSKITGINTQTNAANAGYNLITKYNNPNYICLDEVEVRLATQERFMNIERVAKQIRKTVNAECLIVTLGHMGSIAVDNKKNIVRTPIFSTKVVDTVGAGDAFFSFTAPCVAAEMPLELVSFVGNAVGALAVQIMGNKRPVEKSELIEFIYTITK
jgi:rfaE bifunctional protein kinase chain/domain